MDWETMINGLHLANEIKDPLLQLAQLSVGKGFNGALLIASAEIVYNGWQIGKNDWERTARLLYFNKLPEVVIRLYLPIGKYLGGNPGEGLAKQFYSKIIEPAMRLYGVKHFQVLNELDIEYEGYKDRAQLSGDMYNLAYHIKALAKKDSLSPLLGFPAGGGLSMQPESPQWSEYWNNYRIAVQMYDWIGVHAYGYSVKDLRETINGQVKYLTQNFPDHAIKYTEYGVPLSSYNNYYNRAKDLANMVFQLSKSLPRQVESFYYFVASGSGWEDFDLINDETLDLTPARYLAGAI
jgi:hypothetical protein